MSFKIIDVGGPSKEQRDKAQAHASRASSTIPAATARPIPGQTCSGTLKARSAAWGISRNGAENEAFSAKNVNSSPTRWLRDEDELLRELVDAGASVAFIRKTLNRSEEELRRRGYDLGLPRKWFKRGEPS